MCGNAGGREATVFSFDEHASFDILKKHSRIPAYDLFSFNWLWHVTLYAV